ncbi:MAG TPA: hypothetical protein VGO69_02950 [Pyrinomonadaceae bacterium]|nr:hypothetical protein [Pyrinomonadaceae bacterium]
MEDTLSSIIPTGLNHYYQSIPSHKLLGYFHVVPRGTQTDANERWAGDISFF